MGQNQTKPIAVLKDHKDSVLKVRFIENGKYFISGSGDYTINMYDSNTFELLKTFTGHQEIVNSLCYSHLQNCIVSGSRDNTIKIWNINETTFMKSFTNVDEAGSRILTDNQLDKMNNSFLAQKIKFQSSLESHENWISSLSISPNNKYVVSGSYDKTMKIFDIFTEQCERSTQAHDDVVLFVNYSNDGTKILSCGNDNLTILWDSVDLQILHQISSIHNLCITDLAAFKNDDSIVAIAGPLNQISILDMSFQIQHQIMPKTKALAISVQFSHSGQYLISGDKEGNISIWDSNKFELKNHLKGHSGSIYSLSISPDDLKIISAGDYTVRIWKLENAQDNQQTQKQLKDENHSI